MILILGDIHLGAGANLGKTVLGTNLNSRVADQLDLLNWTLDTADRELVTDIVLTGDIFEEPKPHTSLIALFITWLQKCSQQGVKVHIIIGNHDVLRSGFVYTSPLDIVTESNIEGVHVYRNIDTIYVHNVALTLVPFRDRKSFASESNSDALDILKNSFIYEASAIPDTFTKVMIGHLAIDGSIPVGDEIDDIANELFCPIEFFEGYNQVWMGHVHKPQVMNKEPLIAHIGSMDVSNFGETDHKKHIVLIDSDSGDYRKENIPTRSLRKINIVVPEGTLDSTEFVLNKISEIKEDLNKSIIRVEVSLNANDIKSVNKTLVEKALQDRGVFNISGISEVKKLNVIKKDGSNNSIDTKMDFSSAIKQYSKSLDEADRSSFIDACLSIYSDFKAESKE